MLGVGSGSSLTYCDFSLRNLLGSCCDYTASFPSSSEAIRVVFLRLVIVSNLISLFSVVKVSGVFLFSSVVITLWGPILFRSIILVSSMGFFLPSGGRYSDRVRKIISRLLYLSFLYSILGIPYLRSYVYKIY